MWGETLDRQGGRGGWVHPSPLGSRARGAYPTPSPCSTTLGAIVLNSRQPMRDRSPLGFGNQD